MFGFFRRKSEPAPKTRDDIERDASNEADLRMKVLFDEYRMKVNDVYNDGAKKLKDPALTSAEKVELRRKLMEQMKELNNELWRRADEIHEEYLEKVFNL